MIINPELKDDDDRFVGYMTTASPEDVKFMLNQPIRDNDDFQDYDDGRSE